jgi:pyruvate/2-oxoglutarate dehydrogenase complex dihydrolipoamide dehydrogenase (E3) component
LSLWSAPHCAFRRPTPRVYDLVLQARGRSPNGKKIAVGKAGVTVADRVIPSVAYTDPEVAWVGLTEDSGLVPRVSR